MMHLKDIFKDSADIPEPERKTLEEEMEDYSDREKTRGTYAPEQRRMYCPVCYQDFPVGEEFCPQCGTALEKAMTDEERDELMEAMFDMKV